MQYLGESMQFCGHFFLRLWNVRLCMWRLRKSFGLHWDCSKKKNWFSVTCFFLFVFRIYVNNIFFLLENGFIHFVRVVWIIDNSMISIDIFDRNVILLNVYCKIKSFVIAMTMSIAINRRNVLRHKKNRC